MPHNSWRIQIHSIDHYPVQAKVRHKSESAIVREAAPVGVRAFLATGNNSRTSFVFGNLCPAQSPLAIQGKESHGTTTVLSRQQEAPRWMYCHMSPPAVAS